MKTEFETPRLLLRELTRSDAEGMFAMDSDPEVHRYLGNKPVTSIDDVRNFIGLIRDQYQVNGIGRWAVILKDNGEFLGWAGLKLEKNVNGRDRFYDLGYRFARKYWGNGYATEAARRWIEIGFLEMNLERINAYTSTLNIGSQNVLEKCGLKVTEEFIYDNEPELWYEVTRAEFLASV